jgi:hypothetical protein
MRLARRGEIPTTSWLLAQRTQSRSVVSEMAFDICASVPYHLGYAGQPSTEPGSCHTQSRALMIIPPLQSAAGWVGVPRSMKEYASGTLSHIGHVLGIQQAFFLADLVNNTLDAETLATMKNADQEPKGYAEGITDARGILPVDLVVQG